MLACRFRCRPRPLFVLLDHLIRRSKAVDSGRVGSAAGALGLADMSGLSTAWPWRPRRRVIETEGLVYAVTRPGTSRAGDPSPHDHILVGNVTYMLDAKGGYKALFSALFRDRVEAGPCTAGSPRRGRPSSGAIRSSWITAPSGRLRHWRIAGITPEACDVLSKRSDQIGEYLSEKGYVGYRAANVAARATREVKRGTPHNVRRLLAKPY
jgi:conjugative relaxase-like TrwC/TraI family protein